MCFALICVGLVLPLTLGTGLALAETPVDVRITDIRDTSFVISWTTVNRDTGSIRYGPSASASCEGVALTGAANDRRGERPARGILPKHGAPCVSLRSGPW